MHVNRNVSGIFIFISCVKSLVEILSFSEWEQKPECFAHVNVVNEEFKSEVTACCYISVIVLWCTACKFSHSFHIIYSGNVVQHPFKLINMTSKMVPNNSQTLPWLICMHSSWWDLEKRVSLPMALNCFVPPKTYRIKSFLLQTSIGSGGFFFVFFPPSDE